MRPLAVLLCLLFFELTAASQSVGVQDTSLQFQQALETITANASGAELQDDSYIQIMESYRQHPLNLNSVSEEMLAETQLLSPMQTERLLQYIRSFGYLLSKYELQAIPGWDLETIRKVSPYVTVSIPVKLTSLLRERLKNGSHSILARVSQVIEKSKGYLFDSSAGGSPYCGSPQRLLIRYKYAYRNLLQYGFVAEKDSGEEWFKKSQPMGFDFYSAHMQLRDVGFLKTMVIGDYTLNFGQGLIQCQNLAFKKGPDLFSAKRQMPAIRPYHSFGEYNFHRGIAATLGVKNGACSFFFSSRKLDANIVSDTGVTKFNYVTSIQTSGLHRSKSELADRQVQRMTAFGGSIRWQFNKAKVGFNFIRHLYSLPVVKENTPHHLYSFSGRKLSNASIDYSFTNKNIHFFGELAASDNRSGAMVNGMFINAAHNVDLSLVYRNISKAYRSVNSNAFTENSSPVNEHGLFSGVSIRAASGFQIDAYYDLFKFPWLKYQINRPSFGSDGLVQITYKPSRSVEIYARFKREIKAANYDDPGQIIRKTDYVIQKNWRININCKINQCFTVRNRVEVIFSRLQTASQEGFLMSSDLFYKPALKPFSANVRLMFFETGGYDSRLYAYENDVLYNYSLPVIYGKGLRYYFNLNIDIVKNISCWFRWSQSFYNNQENIGSGNDQISGSRRSEYKCQILMSL